MLQDDGLGNDREDIAHGFFGAAFPVIGGTPPHFSPGFAFDQARLCLLKQVHGNRCLIVRSVYDLTDAPEADAMVTDKPRIVLGVKTADCAPVLFAGRKSGGAPVIAAAHAGWQGAIGGVIESTLAQMRVLGAEKNSVVAAIGPCIGPESYEVGSEFYERFMAEADNEAFFKTSDKPGHYFFDLPGYVEERLKAAGCRVSSRAWRNTYTDENRFFSHRRAVHRGEADEGRQLSVIEIISEGS